MWGLKGLGNSALACPPNLFALDGKCFIGASQILESGIGDALLVHELALPKPLHDVLPNLDGLCLHILDIATAKLQDPWVDGILADAFQICDIDLK